MICGAICYETHSGLGHLARDFFRAGVVQRAFVIRHPRYQAQDWFGEARYDRNTLAQFLHGLDVLLLFENAFNCWDVVRTAKVRGTRIVIIPNYEWTPAPLPIAPDLVLCPSLLDMEYFESYPRLFLPIPVQQHWRLRQRAELFIHNAGHGQVGFAKGTPEVLEAMRHVQSPVKLIVRGQPDEPRLADLLRRYQANPDPRVSVLLSNVPDEDLYATGDVFVNAERYNGLSLPLQEAWASGMLVMTSDRFPANTWLPKEPLIPVASFAPHRVNQTTFERATIDPVAIAATIDAWFGKDISAFSLAGRAWAEEHSWARLGSKYLEALAK